MSKVEQGEPKSCKCGMCVYPAVKGSEYCDGHRGIMESFERKRKLAAASLPESQPAPEMDYEKAAELLVKMARYVAIKSAEKMVSEWLRAHDARVQQSSVLKQLRDKIASSGSHDDQRVNDYNNELLEIIDQALKEEGSNV